MSLGENAFLLDVSSAPATDGYGKPTGAGAVVWTGRVAAHLRRRRVLQSSRDTAGGVAVSQAATLVEIDQLIVRIAAGGPAQILNQPGASEVGQTILVEDLRSGVAAQKRFRVDALSLRAGGGTIADSILVDLGDGD